MRVRSASLLITLLAPASTKVVERLGVAVTVGGGMLMIAAGFLLLERLGQSAGFALRPVQAPDM